MKTAIVLFGGGGHAKVVADVVLAEGVFEIVGIVDERFPVGTKWNDKYKIVSLDKAFKIGKGIVAIGDNLLRSNVVKDILAKSPQFEFVTTVHPSAVLGTDVQIGKGTVVMPLVAINASSFVGDHLIINTRAVIEHDCVLENFVFIAPGVVMGGNVKIGEMSMLGINSSIKHGLSIGENSIIGMGACVIRDVSANTICLNKGIVAIKAGTRKIGDRFLK